MKNIFLILFCAIALFAVCLPCQAAKPAGNLKVAWFVGTEGANGNAFNRKILKGLKACQDKFGISLNMVETTRETLTEDLDRLCENAPDVIIVTDGWQLKKKVQELAQRNSDIKFILINDIGLDLPNVSSIRFRDNEGAYLAGILAGSVTKTNKIGFIGAMDVALINNAKLGFEAGLKDINTDIKLVTQYLDTPNQISAFDNIAEAKQQAELLFDQGADIIFADCGHSINGIIEAAKKKEKFVIAAQMDMDESQPGTVLASVVNNVDKAVFDSVGDLANGSRLKYSYTYGVKEGAVNLSEFKFTRKLVSSELLLLLDKKRQRLAQGLIKVPEFLVNFYYGGIVPAAKVAKIGVLAFDSDAISLASIKGFVRALSDFGYKDPENIRIFIEDAQANAAKLDELAGKFVNDKCDIIVVTSAAALKSVMDLTSVIPIVFCSVANPYIIGAGKSASEHRQNVCGVSSASPIGLLIAKLKSMMPAISKIAVLYNPDDPVSRDAVDNLEIISKKENLQLLMGQVRDANLVQETAKSLSSKSPEAFVELGDKTVLKAVSSLIEAANSMKKPLFMSACLYVEKGASAGIDWDYFDSGAKAASLAAMILAGRPARNTDFTQPQKTVFYLNLQAAALQGLNIDKQAIDESQRVYTYTQQSMEDLKSEVNFYIEDKPSAEDSGILACVDQGISKKYSIQVRLINADAGEIITKIKADKGAAFGVVSIDNTSGLDADIKIIGKDFKNRYLITKEVTSKNTELIKRFIKAYYEGWLWFATHSEPEPVSEIKRQIINKDTVKFGLGYIDGKDAEFISQVFAPDSALKCAIISTGKITDISAQEVRNRFYVEADVIENVSESQKSDVLKWLIGKGYDLLICHDQSFEGAVSDMAAQYPMTKFAILQGTKIFYNLSSYGAPDKKQIYYLAGMFAARMSKGACIGAAGMNAPGFAQEKEAYKLGALSAKPNIKVISGSSPEELVSQGADIMILKDKLIASEGLIALAGIDYDFNAIFGDLINGITDNTFGAKFYTLNLANGGLRLYDYEKSVPQDVKDEIRAAAKDLISGAIKIPNLEDSSY